MWDVERWTREVALGEARDERQRQPAVTAVREG